MIDVSTASVVELMGMDPAGDIEAELSNVLTAIIPQQSGATFTTTCPGETTNCTCFSGAPNCCC